MSSVMILPQTLRRNCFDYFLVKRNDRGCVYSQETGGKVIAYELFTHNIRNIERKKRLSQVFGRPFNEEFDKYDSYESFPCNEEFGKIAWSIKSLDEALKRLDNLPTKTVNNNVDKLNTRNLSV